MVEPPGWVLDEILEHKRVLGRTSLAGSRENPWNIKGFRVEPQRGFWRELLHHRRVLCRTSHRRFWVEPFTNGSMYNHRKGGTFIKGSSRNQNGFSYGDKPKTLCGSTQHFYF